MSIRDMPFWYWRDAPQGQSFTQGGLVQCMQRRGMVSSVSSPVHHHGGRLDKQPVVGRQPVVHILLVGPVGHLDPRGNHFGKRFLGIGKLGRVGFAAGLDTGPAADAAGDVDERRQMLIARRGSGRLGNGIAGGDRAGRQKAGFQKCPA